MNPADITAVIVTRGGYDISEVLESLSGFGEIIVKDNSSGRDDKLWGRYSGPPCAINRVIYTQDDDCIVDAAAVCAAYEPGVIVANSDPYHRAVNAPLYRDGIALIGWGAVYDTDLLRCFERRYFAARLPKDDLFMRECDRVFTALNTVKFIEAPFRHLPRATEPGRMWREPRHLEDLAAIRERIQRAKVAA